MASSSYSPRARWDPIKAFSIHNLEKGGAVSCVGWAPSKRRRCQNPIAEHNRSAAEYLLKEMSYRDPDTVTDDTLEMIAGYYLCRRYHQDQNADMVEKWKRTIRQEQRTLDASRTQHRQSADGPRRGTRTAPQAPAPSTTSATSTRVERTTSRQRQSRPHADETSSSTSRSNNSIDPNDLANDIAQLIRTHLITELTSSQAGSLTVRRAQRILARLGDIINSQLEQESDASSSDNSTESQPESDSDHNSDSSSVTSVDSSNDELSSESSTNSVEDSTNAPPSNRDRLEHCTVRHVTRRPIDHNCPICLEAMPRRRLSDLVWCKGQCGKSFHKFCFETWRETSAGVLRCVNCRAMWTEACEHDAVRPR